MCVTIHSIHMTVWVHLLTFLRASRDQSAFRHIFAQKRCSMSSSSPIVSLKEEMVTGRDHFNPQTYYRQTTMRIISMKGLQALGLALFWIRAASQQVLEQPENICHVCGELGTIDNESKMISTAFGFYTCGSLAGAGIHGNISPANCDAAQTAASEKCGCTLPEGSTPNQAQGSCSICPDDGIVTLADAMVEIPGEIEWFSCGYYQDLASTGQLQADQCLDLQLYTNETCGCTEADDLDDVEINRPENVKTNETYVCAVCGEGMISSTPDAIVNLPSRTVRTCGEFEQAASLGRISKQQCGLLRSFVEESCQCAAGSPVAAPTPAPVSSFDCPICGEGMVVTRPEASVVIPTQPERTCQELLRANMMGNINRQQCGLLQPFAERYCGCIPKELTDKPTGMPIKAPTIAPTREIFPTVSPAPTGWTNQKDGCFSNLMEIYEMERAIVDPSENRRYTLCRDTTFNLGELTEDGEIVDGDAFLMLRPNVLYQCGQSGSRSNNCILKGGDFGLLSLYGLYEDVYETIENVRIQGITFQSQRLFGAVMEAAGDIQFLDCAFKDHTNMAPVLMQWRGEGPSAPIAASRERKLRSVATSNSGLRHLRQRLLASDILDSSSQRRHLVESSEYGQSVTFKQCVFRGNRVSSSMGFPGVIENSFGSELNVEKCIFQDNYYGERGNVAPFGYAIRSYGPINLESSCFMDNTFQAHGPVQVFGAPHATLGNYVRSFQNDMTCEFLAVFAARDDTTDATPVCFDSDASSCPVYQSPTQAPTNGPPTTTSTVAPMSNTAQNTQNNVKASGASSMSQLLVAAGILFVSASIV